MPATRSQADAVAGGAEPEVAELLEDAAAELGGYNTGMNGSEMVATTHGAHPRPQPHGRPSGLACFAYGATVTAQDASRSGLADR
jgi:hypothetical protein